MTEKPQTAIETLRAVAAKRGVAVGVVSPSFEERVAAAAAKSGTTGEVVTFEREGVIVFLRASHACPSIAQEVGGSRTPSSIRERIVRSRSERPVEGI